MSEGLFVYAVLLCIIRLIFYVFYYNCVNMNVGGVNYRTLGILYLVTSEIKLSELLQFKVSWFLYCHTE